MLVSRACLCCTNNKFNWENFSRFVFVAFSCANLHQKKVLQVHKSNFVVQPKTTTMTLVDFNAKEKGYNVWQRFLCIYARRRNDTITTEIRKINFCLLSRMKIV